MIIYIYRKSKPLIREGCICHLLIANISSIPMEDDMRPTIANSSLRVVPDEFRNLFYWLMLSISVVALVGNLLVIRSIIGRKSKFLQKTCIISLAVADICTVLLVATNNLVVLTNDLIKWSLGEFLCYFIPMGQVLFTTASSVILLVIALDRYQSVVFALSRRWDPKPWICICGALMLFFLCTVTSYPMFNYFNYEPVLVIYIGPYTNFTTKPVIDSVHLCVAVDKGRLATYYVSMACLIFLPILCIFIWFYYNIATLIWQHRKPLNLRFNKFEKKFDSEENSTTTTKETNLSTSANTNPIPIPKKKTVQVKRKIRTFRIVVTLMISFVLCRSPYWCLYVIRVCRKAKGHTMWNMNFAFITLNLLNCALNPLLYTFLNETISAIKAVNDFFCKICCWCFSNDEFEDFGKENPFVMENYERKDSSNCRNQKSAETQRLQKY